MALKFPLLVTVGVVVRISQANYAAMAVGKPSKAMERPSEGEGWLWTTCILHVSKSRSTLAVKSHQVWSQGGSPPLQEINCLPPATVKRKELGKSVT